MSKYKHCKHYYKLLSIINKKDEEIAELKKHLQYYENYNSPPSANSLLWRKQKRERRNNLDDNAIRQSKPGRRNGHEGVSHSFRPSESIEHSMDRCRDRDVRKFVEKVRSAGSKLFTFLLHDIDSTNNDCERVLREVVIHRKIRGLLRNSKGMRMFGNMMTAVMTWKLRGLNPLEEVRKYL